ncbi:MAG: hypothetical protein KatS3mg115_1279 [Candidatus Poribacteria bacterium]|nr:MAG: hypothetical protein KatS3mg115_1279 [Candidatus Poribacteria bacterium]
MNHRRRLYGWLLVGLGFLSVFGSVAAVAAEPSRRERERLDRLARELEGAVIFQRHGHIFRVDLGKWEPVDLGPGEYARWSWDGRWIAVYWRRRLFVIRPDGSGRRLVTDEAWERDGCPIDVHPNNREIITLRQGRSGFWAVEIETGRFRLLTDAQPFTGEPGISRDGRRLVGRVGRVLWAVDLESERAFPYVREACSAAISPDGRWLLNNGDNGNPTHRRLNLRDWEMKTIRTLSADLCEPDREWDNFHWSNLQDYIAVQGDNRGESYVVNVRTREAVRVTWVGDTVYPDLWARLRERRTLGAPSLLERGIARGDVAFRLIGRAEYQTERSSVALLNRDYDRRSSALLLRAVRRPTRAALDFAAYDRNVLYYRPLDRAPVPLPVRELRELNFGVLEPGSLVDRLEETPLTPEERAAPLAWEPLIEYLLAWNFDEGKRLAEAGWAVEEHTWTDDFVPVPYQRIVRLYFHQEGQRLESWVQIEFQPWVSSVPAQDEDEDGYREVYGRLKEGFLSPAILERIRTDYSDRLLSPEEVQEWARVLAERWYGPFFAQLLGAEEISAWFLGLSPALKKILVGPPQVLIRARPREAEIYIGLWIEYASGEP